MREILVLLCRRNVFAELNLLIRCVNFWFRFGQGRARHLCVVDSVEPRPSFDLVFSRLLYNTFDLLKAFELNDYTS